MPVLLCATPEAFRSQGEPQRKELGRVKREKFNFVREEEEKARAYGDKHSLRDLQLEAHITEPPFDPRLRTRAGRALIAEERQALAQGEEVGDGKETSEEAAGMAVIDVFAEIFT